MSIAKERAYKIIDNMPENRINLAVNMLELLSAYNPVSEDATLYDRSAFFDAVGKIEIDSESIDSLREESMI